LKRVDIIKANKMLEVFFVKTFFRCLATLSERNFGLIKNNKCCTKVKHAASDNRKNKTDCHGNDNINIKRVLIFSKAF
jgi:hypothetical protein